MSYIKNYYRIDWLGGMVFGNGRYHNPKWTTYSSDNEVILYGFLTFIKWLGLTPKEIKDT